MILCRSNCCLYQITLSDFLKQNLSLCLSPTSDVCLIYSTTYCRLNLMCQIDHTVSTLIGKFQSQENSLGGPVMSTVIESPGQMFSSKMRQERSRHVTEDGSCYHGYGSRY